MLIDAPPLIHRLRWIFYGLLLLATTLGLRAIFSVLNGGHELLNTTQHVPWGLWVSAYIFFLGISTGSFLFAMLVYVFEVKKLEPIGRMALFQALVCLLFGGVLIILDLGHPFQSYKLFTSGNYSSVMAWMGILYNLYIAIVIIELYLALRGKFIQKTRQESGATWLYRLLALGSTDLSDEATARNKRWLKVIGIIGIPIAIFACGGAGSILAVAKARPNWFGGLFPILFLITALASGGAMLTLLTALFSKLPQPRKLELVRVLAYLSLGILIFDALLLTSEALITLYGEIVHDEIGWRLTLFGQHWWIFWFVQILSGIITPILLIAIPFTGRSLFCLSLASFMMVAGIFGMRWNIVVPPLVQPAFDTLPEAYCHSRFAWGYAPSSTEWLVCLGVMAMATWVFLIGNKLLFLNDLALGDE